MNIILMGLPGSGKGTQAQQIVSNFSLLHISTGNMFRSSIQDNTPLGMQSNKYISQGKLVPDEITNGIVKEYLSKSDIKKGFLLDGFPRTLNQAKELEQILKEINERIDFVLYLQVSEKVIIKRLTGRYTCMNCNKSYNKIFNPTKIKNTCDICSSHEFYQRSDDKSDTIRNRLLDNAKNNKKLLEFYKNKGMLYVIDGNISIDDIFSEIKSIVS